MKYRRLSSTGDYVFGYGNTCFVSDAPAVQQAIQTKLNMFQGDYWENTSDGLPFFQKLAGGSKEITDLLLQSRIMQVPNVKGIASFKSSVDSNRKYSAAISVNTVYGTVEVTA
jgi:hypothetical protein